MDINNFHNFRSCKVRSFQGRVQATVANGGGERGSLGSKEPPFLLIEQRKMGVVWLKMGAFQGKLMKRTPLVRVLDSPLGKHPLSAWPEEQLVSIEFVVDEVLVCH